MLAYSALRTEVDSSALSTLLCTPKRKLPQEQQLSLEPSKRHAAPVRTHIVQCGVLICAQSRSLTQAVVTSNGSVGVMHVRRFSYEFLRMRA